MLDAYGDQEGVPSDVLLSVSRITSVPSAIMRWLGAPYHLPPAWLRLFLSRSLMCPSAASRLAGVRVTQANGVSTQKLRCLYRSSELVSAPIFDSGDEFEPNAIGKSKYIPRPVWINPILSLG